MWQEARKQEKLIRGMMVDYKRRAERRKGFYDKIKKDPAQFLQVWGCKAKIHIDPNVASAADNPSIMTKWRGDEEVLIDRFDVRSHLDFLPEHDDQKEKKNLKESEKNEERMLNFERFRTLVQNEALGISESQCLKQIEVDEKYGDKSEKKIKDNKAKIGYTYSDSSYTEPKLKTSRFSHAKLSSDEDTDNDLDLVLDVNRLTSEDKVILNKKSTDFGMEFGDYIRMMIVDNEEKEALKRNKELEIEKSQYSGRKSRRERQRAKEKRLREKGSLSPLSFIVTEEKETNENDSRSSSESSVHRKRKGSESPQRLCFITSFGQDTNEEMPTTEASSVMKEMNYPTSSKIDSLKKLKQNLSRSVSRSRSKSPVPRREYRKKSSSSNSSSDEEKELEKYKKRKERRNYGFEKKVVKSEESSSKVSKNQFNKKNLLIFNSEQNSNTLLKVGGADKFKLLQEKLKKKMKKDIDRQIKKDRRIEKEKKKKENEERREREAKLEHLSEKMKSIRRKERKESTSDSSSSESTSDSSSGSYRRRRSSSRSSRSSRS